MFSRLFLCVVLVVPSFAEMKFRHHFVDAKIGGKNWGQLEVADLDGDKKPDIIIGQSIWGNPDPGLYWYRNTGKLSEWGARTRFANELLSDCGIFAADVDRDGRIDIISSSVWYRNVGKPLFDRYVYDQDLAANPKAGAHDVIAAKLDAERGFSVISQHAAKTHKGLHLYKVPADPTGEWPRTDLTTVNEQHGAVLPRGVGDLNGDGRADIVYIDRWFENQKAGWKEHANLDFWRVGKFGACARTWIADVDRDGRMDIVQVECDMPEAKVAWFRNVRGDGSAWERHLLPESGPVGGYHSLVVSDFDGDGDMDVYVDEMEHLDLPASRSTGPGMYVWENLDGKGARWKKHTIYSGAGGHQAQVADLDGDGDLDIITKTYTGANLGPVRVSVLENLSHK